MIQMECQYTPQDCVRAQRLHLRPGQGWLLAGAWILGVFGIVVAAKMVDQIRNDGSPVVLLILLASAAYLGGAYFWYLPRRARQLFVQQKQLQAKIQIRLDPEGVAAWSEHGRVLTPWDHFFKWKEDRHLFVLYQTDLLFQIFPKRCLESATAIDECRAMLKARISEKPGKRRIREPEAAAPAV